MFLIYGVAFIVVAAILIVTAGMIYHKGLLSARFRGAIAGQVFCVILSSLVGIGMVTLLAFLTEFETQGAILFQVAVAILLIAGGFGTVWFIAKRGASPRAATGSARDSGQHRFA